VVEAPLFVAAFPSVILVPLTDDPGLVITGLTVAIAPTAENGCTKPCWALSYNVTATSKTRLARTPSRITAGQLASIRQQIAVAVGAIEP
jgi:mRNA interferase MazF